MTQAECEKQARALVASVEDEPEGRLELREQFYKRYAGEPLGKYGYGDSEMSFMRWEIKRGVLNPLDGASKAGSPWWRKVNSDFLYYSELAGLLHIHGVSDSDTPQPTQHWVTFIQNPNSRTWYKAHNSSIIEGYRSAAPEVARESAAETIFMNIVLYRLLFAQAMVEDDTLFGDLGEILANPILPSVDAMVHIPEFYPVHYPLSQDDIREIMHKGHHLSSLAVDLLDLEIILPHLPALYSEAAIWNMTPTLATYQAGGKPVYPS